MKFLTKNEISIKNELLIKHEILTKKSTFDQTKMKLKKKFFDKKRK